MGLEDKVDLLLGGIGFLLILLLVIGGWLEQEMYKMRVSFSAELAKIHSNMAFMNGTQGVPEMFVKSDRTMWDEPDNGS